VDANHDVVSKKFEKGMNNLMKGIKEEDNSKKEQIASRDFIFLKLQ
jgi:hypothetical protein